MNNYTIYCTESQTRKALELGAPIEFEVECPVDLYTLERSPYPDIKMGEDGEPILAKPTAEQMIGFLEENNIFININHTCDGYSSWVKLISNGYHITGNLGYVTSRKEATLAAIDAALEYLKENKK